MNADISTATSLMELRLETFVREHERIEPDYVDRQCCSCCIWVRSNSILCIFVFSSLLIFLFVVGFHVERRLGWMEKLRVLRALVLLLCVSLLGFPVEAEASWDILDMGLRSDLPPLVNGLSWNFYERSCPRIFSLVKSLVDAFLEQDVTQAAGLLRLHFHDCFVQGCDASVLLTGPSNEQNAIPNLTLRPEAINFIDELKRVIENSCPGVVSCADILALAARDAVKKVGGPLYPVPLGRRDSQRFASQSVVLASLPPPSANVTSLLGFFLPRGFDILDMVALSGAHTIGRAHCPAFSSRLSPPDPTLDSRLAAGLRRICSNSSNTVSNDLTTPNKFDNRYYRNLMNRQGLFTSDESLFVDSRTVGIVRAYAQNLALFFEQFGLSMIKMSQLDVLTGRQGIIRKFCSVGISAVETQAMVI
eukprot:c25892_g1_i1 orf=106-1365(+)